MSLMVQHGEDNVLIGYETNNRLEEIELPLKGFNEDKRFQELMQAGQIKRIHSKEATLEEIFIKLTGNSL